MLNLNNQLKQAGIKNPLRFQFLLALSAVVTFALVMELDGLAVLALAVTVGEVALVLESIARRASSRSIAVTEAWPSVLESLESAAIAGLSLLEAFRELAEAHSLVVAREFAELVVDLESGLTMDAALAQFGARFGLPCCDLTVEILRQVVRSGGQGLVAALRSQAEAARQHELVIGEIQAKQGWVLGTAKLAVAAPWVVIALVSVRAESARLYASPTGVGITLAGLAASVVAFRFVTLLGKVEFDRRVFA